MGLVTLQEAKDHLKPPGSIDDARILRIIKQATVIVLKYCKLELDAYQDSNLEPTAEVPGDLTAATLLVIGSLYDNADGQNADKDPLSPAVKSLLHDTRKPTLA